MPPLNSINRPSRTDRMAMHRVTNMSVMLPSQSKFSSDRAIREYAELLWGAKAMAQRQRARG